ncbi:sure-like protein [Wolfiporia cocos MD-104 SS10]|uniref:Sure-like protein n=1 Tax=Wolfiporia cocos (strain MD-104) TaxID=742152 RepID=A0A2H3K1U2_WOLCO|nr:sure-like protein [Wolfiporia cocos MD-104 SS10]
MLKSCAITLACGVTAAFAHNIIISNDDGWATAQIRAQYAALKEADYDVILSCPALNQSGKGSQSITPTPLSVPCEFDTCPVGSPPEGFNASDSRLNYVNAYPVDAVRYGIQVLAPEFFNKVPDFVVTGPNIGNSFGILVPLSGTVGAAAEASIEGIPATAFSGASGTQVSYTTLDSDPDAESSRAARLYSALTIHYVQTILNNTVPGTPLLPPNVIVNVNYPSINNCSEIAGFTWVFSRNITNTGGTDLNVCGSTTLPTARQVIAAEGCYVSVTALDAISKKDVDAATQTAVYARLLGLPSSCLH